MNYIIVQAGGKGTRLKHLTQNKPKALVPVGNLPMLFYLFGRYPDTVSYTHLTLPTKFFEC